MTRPVDTLSPLQRFVTVERLAEVENRIGRNSVLIRQLQGGGGGGGGDGTGGISYTQAIGDGVAQAFTVTHNLGTQDVQVYVRRTTAPYDEVAAEIEHTSGNTLTVRTTTVPSAGQFTVVVSGPGDAGTIATFTHTQVAPSTVWSVTHSLNRHPSVTVVDSGDTEVLADVHYIDMNSLTITFGSATSGKAYLN